MDSELKEEYFRGLYFDGVTSQAFPVTLQLVPTPHPSALVIKGDAIARQVDLKHLDLASRVGATRRMLTLPESGSLEVLDNESFDLALQRATTRAFDSWVRWLEESYRAALLTVAAIAVGTWAFLTFAVPSLAARAAVFVPSSVDAQIGSDSLAQLDRIMFEPSTIPSTRQAELRVVFADILQSVRQGASVARLEFRKGGAIGANAFALPSGIVVLTDELAFLAKNDDELRGVFAHEIGHIMHRHALRTLIQSSASALLMLGLLGDVNSATSLVATVPGTLVNAAYSRDFERDADAFAFEWMAQHGVSPRSLGDLLKRVEGEEGGQTAGLLSGHPGLQERVRNAARNAR